jgi:hypothetical protein
MLKKKLMEQEHREHEMVCQHAQELNQLKQELLLRGNETEHIEKQRVELGARVEELEGMLKGCKFANEQKVQQLLSEI